MTFCEIKGRLGGFFTKDIVDLDNKVHQNKYGIIDPVFEAK
jgi:hypothetical protein